MTTEMLPETKPTPEYILRRNYAASARLNLQHYQHAQVLTYLLHPTIKKALPSKAIIGDIATGTGIWLLDLASELEGHGQYEFEGWDISDAQFPHTDSLPKNVQFGTFDCSTSEGVPEVLVGKYDVIHVGLLALVVKGGDPGIWIENFMRMLKPGGFLQWMEGDMPRYISRVQNSGSDSTKYPAMFHMEQLHISQMVPAVASGSIQWITDLDKYFEKHALQDVQSVVYKVDRKYWRAWTETLLLIQEEIATQLDHPELKALIEKAGAELKMGAVNPTLMPKVVIGRKAG